MATFVFCTTWTTCAHLLFEFDLRNAAYKNLSYDYELKLSQVFLMHILI